MRAYLHLSCLAVLLAVVLSAVPALAQPTVLGPTGLVRIPNADALTDDEWNAAYFYIDPDQGPKTNDIVANLGVATGLEVGLAATHNTDGNSTLLNAKYQFAQETLNHPAIAAGVLDLTNNLETTAYVVMSKTISTCIRTGYGETLSPRLTLGLGAGEFSGLFGGVSAVLGDWLTLMIEYDTKDVNIGARFRLSPNVRLHFDGFNGLDGVAFGISYMAGF